MHRFRREYVLHNFGTSTATWYRCGPHQLVCTQLNERSCAHLLQLHSSGKGSLGSRCGGPRSFYFRPISGLKRRVYILPQKCFAAYVNDPARADVFVHSDAGFDWDNQRIVPFKQLVGGCRDAGVQEPVTISMLLARHKIAIGHSAGRQTSIWRSTTFRDIGAAAALLLMMSLLLLTVQAQSD